MYNIIRNYAKRETEKSSWSGEIGSARLTVDAVKEEIVVKLDGVTLPANSVEYLLNFSLQSLQDAYAGAASIEEAQGNWGKKRIALMEGTIGTRGEGGMNDEERAELYVAEQVYRNKYKKGTPEHTALKDMDDTSDFFADIADKLRDKDWFPVQVAARVVAVIEARKKRAAEKAEIAGLGELDI